MSSTLTAMSDSPARSDGVSGTYARVARNSLSLCAVVAACSSCIVTGSPDFSDAEPTKPELTVVDPPTTELLCVTSDATPSFSVTVRSEDVEGRELTAALLRNYGVPKDVGFEDPQPWQEAIGNREVPIGSESDLEPRLVTRSWDTTIGLVETPSCHSITMMVVRDPYNQPPFSLCPCNNQFEQVTWYVGVRSADQTTCDFSSCPIQGQDDFTYCPEDLDCSSNGGAP